jgi:CheY-like chemotaxis protein
VPTAAAVADRRRSKAVDWPRARERRAPPPDKRAACQVLLVDDDVNFVETFGPLLEKAGFVVIAEFTHAAALGYLTSHTPDVLITDLRLGDADGWSLARYARRYQPSLPVIVVTGWSYMIESDEEFGRIPVFLKPFDPDEVIDYLQSTLPGCFDRG